MSDAVSTIAIAKIDDSQRLRPVDPDHAELIAASITERGLLTPIRVRVTAEDEGVYENGAYVLIAGAHRLAALKALKWTELVVGTHVIIADVSDIEAKIDEIDENLARHELNALDRAIFLAERKKLFLEARAGSVRGGDRKSQRFLEKIKGQSVVFETNFAKATAARVGLSKSAINLAIQLVEKLDAGAIAMLRGTALETNQKELFALAALEPEKQRAVARHRPALCAGAYARRDRRGGQASRPQSEGIDRRALRIDAGRQYRAARATAVSGRLRVRPEPPENRGRKRGA